jgi:hypothetical protein
MRRAWPNSNPTNKAPGAGTTEGLLLGSFGAESYGCLAILRLILHLVTYHRLPPTSFRHNFYCDKQGLLT